MSCGMRGLAYKQFSLPAIDKDVKLPAVLNGMEVKALLKAYKLLGTGSPDEKSEQAVQHRTSSLALRARRSLIC